MGDAQLSKGVGQVEVGHGQVIRKRDETVNFSFLARTGDHLLGGFERLAKPNSHVHYCKYHVVLCRSTEKIDLRSMEIEYRRYLAGTLLPEPGRVGRRRCDE